jgi:hypothetical protein
MRRTYLVSQSSLTTFPTPCSMRSRQQLSAILPSRVQVILCPTRSLSFRVRLVSADFAPNQQQQVVQETPATPKTTTSPSVAVSSCNDGLSHSSASASYFEETHQRNTLITLYQHNTTLRSFKLNRRSDIVQVRFLAPFVLSIVVYIPLHFIIPVICLRHYRTTCPNSFEHVSSCLRHYEHESPLCTIHTHIHIISLYQCLTSPTKLVMRPSFTTCRLCLSH